MVPFAAPLQTQAVAIGATNEPGSAGRTDGVWPGENYAEGHGFGALLSLTMPQQALTKAQAFSGQNMAPASRVAWAGLHDLLKADVMHPSGAFDADAFALHEAEASVTGVKHAIASARPVPNTHSKTLADNLAGLSSGLQGPSSVPRQADPVRERAPMLHLAADMPAPSYAGAAQAIKTEAAAPRKQPVPVAEQLDLAIRHHAAKGTDHFTVKLNPADLGTVTVRLSLSGNGDMVVDIQTARSDTAATLTKQIAGLQKSLEQTMGPPQKGAAVQIAVKTIAATQAAPPLASAGAAGVEQQSTLFTRAAQNGGIGEAEPRSARPASSLSGSAQLGASSTGIGTGIGNAGGMGNGQHQSGGFQSHQNPSAAAPAISAGNGVDALIAGDSVFADAMADKLAPRAISGSLNPSQTQPATSQQDGNMPQQLGQQSGQQPGQNPASMLPDRQFGGAEAEWLDGQEPPADEGDETDVTNESAEPVMLTASHLYGRRVSSLAMTLNLSI